MNIRLGITIFVFALVWFMGTTTALAATLSLSPGTGVYSAGQTFTTRVVVNTAGAAINAAEATLTFNTNELSVVSVSRGSTFSLWAVEPSFSNTAGTITFGGGSPAGYTGSNGTVLTITWRSKAAGTARVSFKNGSVLAADGRGTNVVSSLNGGSYTLAATAAEPTPEVIEYVAPANTPGRPMISSATHPSDGWSQKTTAALTWNIPSGVTAVRTLLDSGSNSIPNRVYEPPISEISLEDLSEGIQYFHLQFRNADGWGQVAHYRLAVDTEAPTGFTIVRSDEYPETSPTQVLLLNTTDETSPVTRFAIQHNGGDLYEYLDETGSSTLRLESLEPGQHSFLIEAFDAAGNGRVATFSFLVSAFGAPTWSDVPARLTTTVVPVFFGNTVPNAQVVVGLTRLDDSSTDATAEYEVQADQDGVFRFIPEKRFSAGVYELTAQAIDVDGARSEWSSPVRFTVAPPGVVQFGQVAISVLSVVIPVVALVGLLLLLIIYGWYHVRRIRRYVIAETADALAVFESQFQQLRSTIATDTENLQKSRKTKKLTKAEAQLIDDVQHRLNEAEQAVRKEISEVDDIVSS